MHILSNHAFDALKAAGHTVETVALNEFAKGVEAAKKTEVGAAVAKAITEAEQPGVPGATKAAQVLAIAVPLVMDYAAKGGVSALVSDAETFGKALIESTLADLRQTGAAIIGGLFAGHAS